MQTKVRGTREQFTDQEVFRKCYAHLIRTGQDIRFIKTIKREEDKNLISCIGYEGELLYAFNPPIVVDSSGFCVGEIQSRGYSQLN